MARVWEPSDLFLNNNKNKSILHNWYVPPKCSIAYAALFLETTSLICRPTQNQNQFESFCFRCHNLSPMTLSAAFNAVKSSNLVSWKSVLSLFPFSHFCLFAEKIGEKI